MSEKDTKRTRRGFGSMILSYLLYAIVAVAVIALFSGGQNWLHSHNRVFREGSAENLNEIIAAGQELPMDQFVSLEVKGVLGTYATNTTSNTSNLSGGAKFTSGVDYYYAVVLEDGRIITVIACDRQDTDGLNAVSDALDAYAGSGSLFDDPAFPSYTITGKLRELTDQKVIGYYNSTLSAAGFDSASFGYTTIALDASAVRTDRVLLVVGAVALGLVILILARRSARKREQEEERLRREADQAPSSL